MLVIVLTEFCQRGYVIKELPCLGTLFGGPRCRREPTEVNDCIRMSRYKLQFSQFTGCGVLEVICRISNSVTGRKGHLIRSVLQQPMYVVKVIEKEVQAA